MYQMAHPLTEWGAPGAWYTRRRDELMKQGGHAANGQHDK